eukprot:Em0019g861a
MPLTTVGKWTVLYGLVAVEAAAVLGTYSVWHKMNVSQDYRLWMFQNHPRVLDLFYRSCDLVGDDGARARAGDYRNWGVVSRSR